MKTIDNLHNLHTNATEFFSPKWKSKSLVLRQITYDTANCPDTFFVIDKNTLELFIYFEPFGTKQNPRILKIEKLSEDYIDTIKRLAELEIIMLYLISIGGYENLKKIRTANKLKEAITSFPRPE